MSCSVFGGFCDALLLGVNWPKPIDRRCASCIFLARLVLADISLLAIWGAEKGIIHKIAAEKNVRPCGGSARLAGTIQIQNPNKVRCLTDQQKFGPSKKFIRVKLPLKLDCKVPFPSSPGEKYLYWSTNLRGAGMV